MTEKTEDEATGPRRDEREPAAPPAAEPAGPPEAEPVGAAAGPPRAAEPEATLEPEPEPVAAVARPAAAPPRRGLAGVLAALALLLAIGALAGVAWMGWTGEGEDEAAAASRRALAAAIAGADDAQAELRSGLTALGERVDGLERSARDRSARLDALDDGLDALGERVQALPPRVASLESAVSSLAGISAGSRRAWLLAEAEHYLQIANAEIQLAGDPEQALLALRFAEERIRSLEDPALTGVREALTDEIRALEAMETPDLAGVTMTLASLADSVEALPLAREAAPERETARVPEEASGFDRALASVRSAFSDIVSVRRTDESVEPLLSPEAEYFLRENLGLRLQIARLALLRGEQAVLDRALADAAEWLRRYFDVDARAVQSALGTIGEIREADWSVSAPDISTSLGLLRAFRERLDAAAMEPGPAGDEPAQ